MPQPTMDLSMDNMFPYQDPSIMLIPMNMNTYYTSHRPEMGIRVCLWRTLGQKDASRRFLSGGLHEINSFTWTIIINHHTLSSSIGLTRILSCNGLIVFMSSEAFSAVTDAYTRRDDRPVARFRQLLVGIIFNWDKAHARGIYLARSSLPPLSSFGPAGRGEAGKR